MPLQSANKINAITPNRNHAITPNRNHVITPNIWIMPSHQTWIMPAPWPSRNHANTPGIMPSHQGNQERIMLASTPNTDHVSTPNRDHVSTPNRNHAITPRQTGTNQGSCQHTKGIMAHKVPPPSDHRCNSWSNQRCENVALKPVLRCGWEVYR